MNEWGPKTYGDPCSGCGFSWQASPPTIGSIIDTAAVEFESLVAGRTGSERMPSLAWSVRAYVWHAGDNLRIWAERLVGAASGGIHPVPGYDQDQLAEARGYDSMPVGAALWSLARATGDWHEALSMIDGRVDVSFEHPTMGSYTVADVARQVAHDLFHHLDDVRRILLHHDP
jgi:hypothetical protein